VFFHSDATPNDFASTAFSNGTTLLAGRTYRMGMGASTDFLCADTTGGTLCPAADPDNGIPAPQGPGLYGQSASMNVTFSLTAVPEPSTALLVGLGALLLGVRRRS
jgi:PEP-CTERM motif